MPELTAQGVRVVKVEYTNKAFLVKQLTGVDTVLSFILNLHDPGNIAQKTLIDACVEAGVRRFAPCEWATRSKSGIAEYAPKDEVHEYLKLVNQEKHVGFNSPRISDFRFTLEITYWPLIVARIHSLSTRPLLELLQLSA